MIDVIYYLKDQLIIWPNQEKKKMENMKNSNQKEFFDVVEILNGTNIVLKFKLGGIFKRKIFFN